MRYAWPVLLVIAACGGDTEKAVKKVRTGPRAPAAVRFRYEIDGDAAVAAQAAEVMQRRLDRAGIDGVTRADGAVIALELPAMEAEEIQRAKMMVVRVGRLTVHVVDEGAAPMQAIAEQAVAMGVATRTDAWRGEGGRTVEDVYLVAADGRQPVTLQEAKRSGCWNPGIEERDGMVMCRVSGRRAIEQFVAAAGVRIPDDRVLMYEKLERETWRTYYVERANGLVGAIVDAEAKDDQVWLKLEAARAFGELTAAHVGDKIVLVLDDRVVAAPIVQSAIRGGKLALPAESAADARELAVVLVTGPLPAPVRELSVEKL